MGQIFCGSGAWSPDKGLPGVVSIPSSTRSNLSRQGESSACSKSRAFENPGEGRPLGARTIFELCIRVPDGGGHAPIPTVAGLYGSVIRRPQRPDRGRN